MIPHPEKNNKKSFSHSFHKHFLSTSYGSGTEPGPSDSVMSKTTLPLSDCTVRPWGGKNNGSNKKWTYVKIMSPESWGQRSREGAVASQRHSRPKLLLSFCSAVLGRRLQEGRGAESAGASVPPECSPNPRAAPRSFCSCLADPSHPEGSWE